MTPGVKRWPATARRVAVVVAAVFGAGMGFGVVAACVMRFRHLPPVRDAAEAPRRG